MSIRREVEHLVDIQLSATMLWNHPTIASLAGYLAKQLVPQEDSECDSDIVDGSTDSVLDSLFDSVESTSANTEGRI
jgi:phthiocerol/phenolphthiocerol synthesis type-I polyketide synthase A